MNPRNVSSPGWQLLAGTVVLGVALLIASCTDSENLAQGTGGSTGSGGASSGSGGASGSGGKIGSGGSSGSGGNSGSTGSGGSTADSGAGDTGSDAGPMELSYAKDIAYELYFSCGGCHLGATINGNFNLKILTSENPGPDAYPTIMGNVNAEHAGCARLDTTKKRVVAGKPDNSLLFVKISVASPPAGCGGHMPMGTSITDGQIAKIKTWIMQGAKP